MLLDLRFNIFKSIIAKHKTSMMFISVLLFSASVFSLVYLYEKIFSDMMSVASYLTWHSMFEFSSILICFAVFSASFFTYDQTKSLRSAFLGSVLLAVGIIDAFHTLSYKGMAEFFILNTSANRATTFWVISKLVASIGFVIAGFIDVNKKSELRKWIFLYPPIIFSFSVLFLVTYFPEFFPAMFIEGYGLTELKKGLEFIIILLFGVAIIKFLAEYKKSSDNFLMHISVALLLNIIGELAFVSYSNVNDIYNYLGHVYKVASYFIIFRIMFINDVQKPYIELANAKGKIKDYAENLDRIVEARTEALVRVNKRHLENLEYARDIQRSMLPLVLPQDGGANFFAKYFPAESVSGDFYNVFKIDENNTGLYIGDVSGHGVPAAMLMVFLNQTINSVKEAEGDNFETIRPSYVLNKVYESFNKTNFKEDIYIVLLYAVYNRITQELTFASAGLNVQPLIIKGDGEIIEMAIAGFPICKFIEYYDVKYEDSTISFDEGDKVLFYTDGIIEAENKSGERFSEMRLKTILHTSFMESSDKLADTIERKLFKFMDSNILKDDISYLIMEIKRGTVTNTI